MVPAPQLQKDSDGFLVGQVLLLEWSKEPVEIMVTASDRDDLSPEQLRAYEFAIQNAESVKAAILAALPNYYEEVRQIAIDSGEKLRKLSARSLEKGVRLNIVHIREDGEGEFANVGYEFEVDWDDEHGMGVLAQRDQIIEVGEADVSFE